MVVGNQRVGNDELAFCDVSKNYGGSAQHCGRWGSSLMSNISRHLQVKLCKCLLLNIVLSYIVCPNISDINHHVDEALVNLVLELRQQRRAEINLKRRRRSSIQVSIYQISDIDIFI